MSGPDSDLGKSGAMARSYSGDEPGQIFAEVFDPAHPTVTMIFVFRYPLDHPEPWSVLRLESVRICETDPSVPELRTSLVRDLPLARWESSSRVIAQNGLWFTVRGESNPELDAAVIEATEAAQEEVVRSLLARRYPTLDADESPAGLRRKRSLERLAQVAVEYRQHVANGLSDPAAAIARQHDVGPGTARTWVHRARAAGLLDQAVGQTAGERRGFSMHAGAEVEGNTHPAARALETAERMLRVATTQFEHAEQAVTHAASELDQARRAYETALADLQRSQKQGSATTSDSPAELAIGSRVRVRGGSLGRVKEMHPDVVIVEMDYAQGSRITTTPYRRHDIEVVAGTETEPAPRAVGGRRAARPKTIEGEE